MLTLALFSNNEFCHNAVRAPTPQRDRESVPTIDIHFHVLPPLFVDLARRNAFAEVVSIDGSKSIPELAYHPAPGIAVEQGPPIRPGLLDPALILAEMDRRRLDIAAISPAPQLFAYWAPAEVGELIARAVNDGLAEMRRAHPDRLLPLASLPLQDASAAARELERACRDLGLRGAAICTHVNGIDLDIADIAPVFSMAEKLDVPLFLHPQNAGDVSRLQDYHLWNLVGFPTETAISGARLLLSGVFERHPGLKVVLAHGGGFLPYQLGRLDHGYKVRRELNERLPKPPTAYLKNIYCDSLTHSAQALRFLVDRIGSDRVVLGTDHPFDMGSDDPVKAIDELGLPRAQRDSITGNNLAKLLKLT
jgi:aminocarboxymuconate-semialdehyde decarboxylase